MLRGDSLYSMLKGCYPEKPEDTQVPCASLWDLCVLQGQCKAEWTFRAAKSPSPRKYHQRVVWSPAGSPWALRPCPCPEGYLEGPQVLQGWRLGCSRPAVLSRTLTALGSPTSHTSCILKYFKTTLNYARACSGLWPGKSWSSQSGKMPHSDISLSCSRQDGGADPDRGLERWWPWQKKGAELLWDCGFRI